MLVLCLGCCRLLLHREGEHTAHCILSCLSLHEDAANILCFHFDSPSPTCLSAEQGSLFLVPACAPQHWTCAELFFAMG